MTISDIFRGHPTLFWPEETTREIIFYPFSGGSFAFKLDETGSPVGDVPGDSVKFCWRNVTRFVNAKGYENYSSVYEPRSRHSVLYIGVMCSRSEALERAFNELQYQMLCDHSNGKYFINPAGIAWPYDEGDKVYHPDQFGLVIPPVESRSMDE